MVDIPVRSLRVSVLYFSSPVQLANKLHTEEIAVDKTSDRYRRSSIVTNDQGSMPNLSIKIVILSLLLLIIMPLGQ